MGLSPGAHVGPYQIVAALGAGGMGEVWRARDSRLGRDVAVKVLHGAVSSDPERRSRFEREARAVAAISHPNILAIFDIGEHEGQLYVVTELLEGQTLRERLASGPLPYRKVAELGVQVAKGLTAAHDRNIIHRDLKPENLFCTNDGQTKILDFGLARQLAPADAGGETRTVAAATDPGTILGTVGYMAPEQVRGQTVDARTDLFALGAVLYEAASGTRAFRGDTAADTITAILREDPPEIATSRIDFSPAFDRIVRHCLEKVPAERFQTARDVAFALASLSGSTPSAASGETPVTTERARRRFGLLPVAAALVVATAVAGVAIGRWMAPAAATWTFATRTYADQAMFNGRFMPDGETVIFSAAVTRAAVSLFESRIDRATPRPFGAPNTQLLSVSSKGELLVLSNTRFVGQRRFRGTLGRMTVDGAPRAIAEDVVEADWLPDGSDFVVVRVAGQTETIEFPMGTPVLTVNGYISTPRVSPDGTRVAFMEHQAKFDNRGWVKVVDRAGKVMTLAGEYTGEEGVAWSPDGREVLFAAAAESAGYNVFAVSADGGADARLRLTTPGDAYLQDARADGALLISSERNRYGVVARAATGQPERDLTPSDQVWSPSLSQDGTRVLLSDGRDGHDYGVELFSINGGPGTRLGDGQAGNLSPDGRWAVAVRYSTNQCVLYPTGAGAPVPIDLGPGAECVDAFFSGHGPRLRVVTRRSDGTREALVMDAPGGSLNPFRLPAGLRGVARVGSPAGRLAGLDLDGNFVVVEPDGSLTRAKGLEGTDNVLGWSGDDRWMTVTLLDAASGAVDILRVDWRTGTRTKLDTIVPRERTGLMNFAVVGYEAETGAYLYFLVRRTSALHVAMPR